MEETLKTNPLQEKTDRSILKLNMKICSRTRPETQKRERKGERRR